MKKILSIFLVVFMLASIVAIPANAAADSYVGYSAARVVKVDTSEMTDINDYETFPSKTEYKIADAEGLNKVAKLVNNGTTTFAGVTLYLADNIDLNGSSTNVWTPIGVQEDTAYFSGTLDGQGYTISRMWAYVDSTIFASWATTYTNTSGYDYSGAGLIGTGYNCTVRNVVIAHDSKIYSNQSAERCGAIMSNVVAGALVENCYNQAYVYGSDGKAGGIVGYWYVCGKTTTFDNTLTINNCTNAGYVYGHVSGGILGEAASAVAINNCRNVGQINGYLNNGNGAGGILGRVRNNAGIVDGCINNGTITGRGNGGNYTMKSAGIVCTAGIDFTIQNCLNYGECLVKDGVTPAIEGILAYNDANKTITASGNENKAGQSDPTIDVTDIYIAGLLDNMLTTNTTAIFHGTQETATSVNADGDEVYSIRFVGSIDSLNYAYVGFRIEASWGTDGAHTYDQTASAVYSTLVAGTDEGIKTLSSYQVRGAVGYIYAFTLNDIPTSVGEVTFKVTPYSQSASGISEGTAYEVVYNAGNFVSITAA